MLVKEKLSVLRLLMKEHSIDAWIIPSADPHQSEYVAPCWQARAWFSGFDGSAGTVVVTHDKAGLWTDSRYYIQAEKQLEGSGIELFKYGMPGVPGYTEWLAREMKNGNVIGFDGTLQSVKQVNNLQASLNKANLKHVSLNYKEDLIGKMWVDRPALPLEKISVLDESFSGESRVSKLDRIRTKMQAMNVDGHFVSSLDDIAWIFNIRGTDIKYNPVVIAYAYISQDEAVLFMKAEKLTETIKEELKDDGVLLHDYEEVSAFLHKLPKEDTILIDPFRISQKMNDLIQAKTKEAENISIFMKAIKNETELEGFRLAHIRDGVAMVKWMNWLHQVAGKEEHNEVTIADKLEEFRRMQENNQGLSFNSIMGYKENGAIIHYSASPETASEIKAEGMLLTDSGGQYLEGTTDITRTIWLGGEPAADQKRNYTLVLKGNIDLAKAKFPKGTSGAQLDTFARMALWEYGLNFGHGTGHGMGHFLCVHEGPQSISPRGVRPIEAGMVSSNEPGYYLEGEYGIRLENVIVAKVLDDVTDIPFYGFDTITMCPFDRNLIDVELLTVDERNWLNGYHKQVFETLAAHLNQEETAWLEVATAEI